MNIERIKEILYDDGNGIFTRLRNGDYSISGDEKNQVIAFADYCNNQLKGGSISTDAAIIALELVHSLPEYNEKEWTTLLAEEVLLKMEKGVEI